MKQELIVKSNKLLQHPLYQTSVELKIFSKLILAIKENPNAEVYDFEIKYLLEIFECNKNDYSRIKTIAKNMNRSVDINEDAENIFCDIANIFIRIIISKKGIISFEVSKYIKPYILNLNTDFTRYYFKNIKFLKSVFSIRIYELLKQHEYRGNIKFDIEKLRHFIGIEEGSYTRFNDFKRFVLLVAQKELKEQTDIYFEFEEIKRWKKVVEIVFLIKKNKSVIDVKLELEPPPKNNEQVKHLVAMGVTHSTAQWLAAEFTSERIDRGILYTQNQQQLGKLKNPASFVVTAIKKDYTDGQAAEKRRKVKVQKEQETRTQEQKAAEEKAAQEIKTKNNKIIANFRALPSEEQETITQEFMKSAGAFIAGKARAASNEGKDMLSLPTVRAAFLMFLNPANE